MSVKGKTALVTGASKGIGRAIALALGRAGVNVIVTDVLMRKRENNRDELKRFGPLVSYFAESDAVTTESTAEEIKKMGVKSAAMRMDVTDREEIKKVINTVESDFNGVDILVNNAALMDVIGKFETQDHWRWMSSIEVNIAGVFNCSQAVWNHMMTKKWGRIINISSITGTMGAKEHTSYGASKAGIIGFTKSLALEGGRYNITVNAVCPGFIETETVSLYDETMKERIARKTVFHRLGKPEEVASLVLFLASEDASYITGAAIPIAGGIDLLKF